MRRPGRARDPHGDAGLSLVELLVGAAVAVLVMGAATAMFTASLQTNKTNVARVASVNAAREGAEAFDRATRNAVKPSMLGDGFTADVAVIEATATRLRFYGNIDNAAETVGPSRVTFDLTGGTLVQTVQTPSATPTATAGFVYCDDTVSTCPVRRTVLTTSLLTGSAFSYTATDGTALVPPAAGLDSTSRGLVNQVELRLVAAGTGSSGPTTLVSRVDLVNQDSSRGASSS